MKRVASIIAVLGIFVLGLTAAACGGDDGSEALKEYRTWENHVLLKSHVVGDNTSFLISSYWDDDSPYSIIEWAAYPGIITILGQAATLPAITVDDSGRGTLTWEVVGNDWQPEQAYAQALVLIASHSGNLHVAFYIREGNALNFVTQRLVRMPMDDQLLFGERSLFAAHLINVISQNGGTPEDLPELNFSMRNCDRDAVECILIELLQSD